MLFANKIRLVATAVRLKVGELECGAQQGGLAGGRGGRGSGFSRWVPSEAESGGKDHHEKCTVE